MTQPQRHLQSVNQPSSHQVDTFVQALHDMPDAFLLCRDPGLGHDWHVVEPMRLVDANLEVDVPKISNLVRYVRRVVQCRNCDKRGVDNFILKRRGGWSGLERVSKRVYSKVDNYDVKGTGGLTGKGDLARGELFRRLMLNEPS